jgi:two-component system sensor kinase FixL
LFNRILLVLIAVCLLTIGAASVLLLVLGVHGSLRSVEITANTAFRTGAVVLAVMLLAAASALVGVALLLARRGLSELRSQRTFLKGILDAVPGAIVTVDHSGNICSFSAKAERMLGITAAEAHERTFSSLFAEEALPELHHLLAQVRARTDVPVYALALMARREDGHSIPIELHIGGVSRGEEAWLVAFMHDLTDRQSADQQSENVKTELLHMSRLINMGEIAASLAHELNQPLAALSAYLESATRLLCRSPGERNELMSYAVENATAQAMRAGNVIRRMREFVARGETEKRVESVSNMVKEALALAVVDEEAREVEFEPACDPGADLVLANKTQIQQVLLNLIRNGIESMRDAENRRLRVTSEALANGMITVSVSDTGSGIAPEVAATLFQPFMTTKEYGLGVGLSISRTIVESHGGRLSAEANPGGGTIFRFTLRSGSFMEGFGEDGV